MNMVEELLSTEKMESLTPCPKIPRNIVLRIYKNRSKRQLGKDGLDELVSYLNDQILKLIDELEPSLEDCNKLLRYQRWQRISGTVVKRAISRLEGDKICLNKGLNK